MEKEKEEARSRKSARRRARENTQENIGAGGSGWISTPIYTRSGAAWPARVPLLPRGIDSDQPMNTMPVDATLQSPPCRTRSFPSVSTHDFVPRCPCTGGGVYGSHSPADDDLLENASTWAGSCMRWSLFIGRCSADQSEQGILNTRLL